MANRLEKTANLVFVPGVAPVKPVAAYCVTDAEIVGWKIIPPRPGVAKQIIVFSPPTGAPRIINGPYGPTIYTGEWVVMTIYEGRYGGGKEPIYKYTETCFSEIVGIAGSPGRIDLQASSAWDAGAMSISPLASGKQLEIEVKDSPVAVMIGVGPHRAQYNYSALSSGVVIRDGTICEIKSGVEGPPLNIRAPKLIVRRSEDDIQYLFGGQLVATGTVSAAKSYVYAMLYSIGDYVENPKISTAAVLGSGAELRMECEIDPTPRGTSDLKIQAAGERFQSGLSVFIMRASGEPVVSSDVYGVASELEAIAYIWGRRGENSYGQVSSAHGLVSVAGAATDLAASGVSRANGVFAKFKGSGTSSRTERIATTSQGIFPSTLGYGLVMNGGVLSGESQMSFAGLASEGQYLGGNVKVCLAPRVSGYFDEGMQGVLLAADSADIGTAMVLDSAIVFAFYDGVDISHGLDIFLYIDIAFQDVLEVGDGVTLNAILELALREQLRVSTKATGSASVGVHADVLQYAVNATTGALTRYRNFGFSSFATVRGVTYAATQTGVYKLTGDSDAGDMLSASIDFGASDNGSANLKRLSSVYMGVSTDGEVYVRVAGDGEPDTLYKATNYKHEARAVTSKGMAARHWRIGLEVIGASTVDVDNVEVEIGVSQRRLGGRR